MYRTGAPYSFASGLFGAGSIDSNVGLEQPDKWSRIEGQVSCLSGMVYGLHLETTIQWHRPASPQFSMG